VSVCLLAFPCTHSHQWSPHLAPHFGWAGCVSPVAFFQLTAHRSDTAPSCCICGAAQHHSTVCFL